MLTLLHITSTTGHSRWSPRSEVADGVLAQLRPVVAECERTGRAECPSPTGLIELRRIDDGSGSRHVAVWAIHPAGGPCICTLALAMHSRPAASLWRRLHTIDEPGMPRATSAAEHPPAPWLLAMLHLPIIEHPDMSGWLGDLERCIAWAWIEHIWRRA